jgi:hypothetical protein
MWLAARRGTALPPIAVYRIGDEHFVRDGHHRVTVARALGAAGIEADVVELRRRPRSGEHGAASQVQAAVDAAPVGAPRRAGPELAELGARRWP